MSTRLLRALAGLLAVSGLVLVFWPAEQNGLSRSPSPPASSTSVPGPASKSDGGTSPGAEERDHEDDLAELAAQQEVVEAFAAAFTAHVDQDDWLASLKPYVTHDLLEGFTYTDPRQRPAGRAPRVTHLEPGDLFQVSYRGGQSVACTLTAAADGRWVIASVVPVRPPAPTGSDV